MLNRLMLVAGLCAGMMIYGGTVRFAGTPIPSEENAVRQIQNVVALQHSEIPDVILRYDETFGNEEWALERKDGGAVYITGGRTRGVLYGAIDFIEKYLGACLVSVDYTYIPDASTVIIPKDISWRQKPAFDSRNIYCIYENFPANYTHYHAMLRMNGASYHAENGFLERDASPTNGAHVYYEYGKDLPLEHCWTNPRGEKEPTRNDCHGQICYTDPYVREYIAGKVLEFIRKDRAAAAKAGEPLANVYELSANDCMAKCYCENCCAFEREHNLSGLVIDFTNAVASAVAKEYPDVRLQCFGYKDTMVPPKGIKANANVSVRLAFLDKEFDHFENDRDVLKPLSHPQNQWYRNILLQWSECAENLAVWDYWKYFHDPFQSPIGYVRNRADYLKLYKQINARRLFVESEITCTGELIYSFKDMEIYLGAHLMVDPEANVDMLVAKYMNAAYGPAAGIMQEYMVFLEQETAREDRSMGTVPVEERVYLTPEFFARCNAYLDEAEKLARGNEKQWKMVQQERLSVDIAYGSMFGADDNLRERILRNLKEVIASHTDVKPDSPMYNDIIRVCISHLK